ncbi:MAG TPA: sodium:proton antiporter, partial [Bacteroidia bacterium]|nr:sodium:proton antiporter [Bacteroidia bacterium]
MSQNPVVLITCLLLLGYGLFSKRFEKTIITAPMLFTTAGLLLSLIPFSSIHNGITAPWIKTIAEI